MLEIAREKHVYKKLIHDGIGTNQLSIPKGEGKIDRLIFFYLI